MIHFVLVLIAVGLAQILFSLGVSPWVLLIASTLALLFWHRFLGVVASGMIRLSLLLRAAGLPGEKAVRAATRWLTSVEGVRAANGAQMTPSDVDHAVRLADLRAEQRAQDKARKRSAEKKEAEEQVRLAALRSEAEAIFEENYEDAVFLIAEREGFRRSRSKIGGCPTLPPGLDWPKWEAWGDWGFHFLAEIHLDEVPRGLVSDALPETGVLYFFLEMGETADLLDGCVLYAPKAGPRAVEPHENLGDLQRGFARHPDHDGLLIETPVRPTEAPVPRLTEFDTSSLTVDLHRCLGKEANQRYRDEVLAEGFIDGRQQLEPEENYVFNMIGGPKLDTPNPTDGHGVKLLQLDSAGSLGLQFGDMGVVEFWIDEDDLRMGRFDLAFIENASC